MTNRFSLVILTISITKSEASLRLSLSKVGINTGCDDIVITISGLPCTYTGLGFRGLGP